ncbi:MAG: 30S ribosomal protein S7 [Planctomycetota bacterium]|nr:30S ribosomal protein S7 [Planctomycetota bacterium]
MARKYKPTERFLKPDPRYGSLLVSKFINCIMERGKKSVAQEILYQAFEQIKKKMVDVEPLKVFEQALNNVKPVVEVRSRRVGGATYQVPVEVPQKRQVALAMKWIVDAARAKKGKPMCIRLADELVAAYNKEGAACKKREDTHKMAEANKAFAHLAW